MTARSLTRILPLCLVLAVACTSDREAGFVVAPVPPDPPNLPAPTTPTHVLTTLKVSPDSSQLIAGYTQSLKIEARDQFGEKMPESYAGEWADKSTYVSSAPQIAAVNRRGEVSGEGAGTATITASLTLAGVTRSASMTALVELPTATSATLTANPDGTWSPPDVSLRAGATVTWVVPDGVRIGTIWLDVFEPIPEKLEFVDGVAKRTFSTAGRFYYGTGGGLMWWEEGGRVQVF